MEIIRKPEWDDIIECWVCGAEFLIEKWGVGRCPKCVAAHEWAEQYGMTKENVREAIAAAVVGERQACAAAQCQGCQDGWPYDADGKCHLRPADGERAMCWAIGIRSRGDGTVTKS